MRGLGIHKHILISDTKQTLGLQVGCIKTLILTDKFITACAIKMIVGERLIGDVYHSHPGIHCCPGIVMIFIII